MAFNYLKGHAAEFGGDTTRVSIGGDSAGGNLAIATAMTVGGKSSVYSLIPIYPVTELFTRGALTPKVMVTMPSYSKPLTKLTLQANSKVHSSL